MMESPYSGKPEPGNGWAFTQRLVASHPLKPDVLRDAVIKTWGHALLTTVGAGETSW